MHPLETIQAFDRHLTQRELQLEATVIGGSALVLLGVITRQTRDLDVLAPPLSNAMLEAARSFAEKMRARDTPLDDDWLNNGPAQLAETLPEGWRERTQLAFEGAALQLHTLGRADLLKTKLFALCDRGTDLLDCLALAPSTQEIDDAERWVAHQDANTLWPAHVKETFADLARRLSDGV